VATTSGADHPRPVHDRNLRNVQTIFAALQLNMKRGSSPFTIDIVGIELAVGKLVAAKAFDFNKSQQQISINLNRVWIWFATRRSLTWERDSLQFRSSNVNAFNQN